MRKRVETMEVETRRFYEWPWLGPTTPASVNFSAIGPGGAKHEQTAEAIPVPEEEHEATARRRLFVLQVIQPGLAGAHGWLGVHVAPLFAAADATRHDANWNMADFPGRNGRAYRRRHQHGVRGSNYRRRDIDRPRRPSVRGLVCGLMTALGGLGHTLPYLIRIS